MDYLEFVPNELIEIVVSYLDYDDFINFRLAQIYRKIN